MNHRNIENGFTLIEVLVTLLILSIGLLGLAGLQGQSLLTNNQAYVRSTATALSNDIIHRMRTSRASAIIGDYDQSIAGEFSILETDCEDATGCTDAQMAGTDLFRWDAALLAGLENGAGVVCIDSTPNDPAATPINPLCDGTGPVYAIKIFWGPTAAAPESSFISSHQP